ETHVAHEVLQERDTSHVVHLFLAPRHTAHRGESAAPGLLRAQAARDEILDLVVEMKLELFVELGVHGTPAPEHQASRSWTTCVIAAESRSQLPTSWVSCFRPAFVRA